MKLLQYIKHPLIILVKLDNLNIIRLPDKLYLKILFKYMLNEKLNLKHPKTFNEKIQWLKLYNRNPEYTKMVDKYEAKKYVASIIGEEHVIPTLGIYDKFEDIDFDKLPNQFVMKCTHDSGGLIIVKNKKNLNIKAAREKIEKCLKRNYFYRGREWAYKNVKPRIIIEKYMIDGNNSDLNDYKLMCFNGKVRCSFVCSERRSNKGLAVDFFDNEWNHLQFRRHYRNLGKEIKCPTCFNEMKILAEKLSENIPFVRVDFYEINNKVYFGELTFYPGNGFEEFIPKIWDEKLGDLISLDDLKK